MERDKKFTRLTVEQSEMKVTWEVPYEDVDGIDMVNALKTILVGMTFSPDCIPDIFASWLEEYAKDKYDIIEKDENDEEYKILNTEDYGKE
jgi:hypothetical protein